MAASSTLDCSDFSEFQDAIQKMRQIDDKIIYLINAIIPTESFKGQVDATTKCKDLYEQINNNHQQRDAVINKCLSATREKVKQLQVEKSNRPSDIQVLKAFGKEQSVLRLLETEQGVEEVIQKRTNKIYSTKCREFYKPNNPSSGK